MKRALLTLLFLSVPLSVSSQAILNVERLQGEEVSGLNGEFAGRFRMASGNTDFLQVGGDLGVGYLITHHWVRVYAGAEHLDQRGKGILDNRYLHLRYNFRFSDRFRTFHFFQIQSNENLLLDQRRLWGTGLRYRVLQGTGSRLELGSGLMLEKEQLNEAKLGPVDEAETTSVRMSNVAVGSGTLGDGRRWVTVVYYQPNVDRFNDYRLSAEAGLEIELVSTLRLDVSLTWRHDSRAPANLKDDDVGLSTGIRYRIR
jgi:hypothetical protein